MSPKVKWWTCSFVFVAVPNCSSKTFHGRLDAQTTVFGDWARSQMLLQRLTWSPSYSSRPSTKGRIVWTTSVRLSPGQEWSCGARPRSRALREVGSHPLRKTSRPSVSCKSQTCTAELGAKCRKRVTEASPSGTF
ncbi:hypothetical protein B0T14DRAFT_587727, partial [Immersiella caudata]